MIITMYETQCQFGQEEEGSFIKSLSHGCANLLVKFVNRNIIVAVVTPTNKGLSILSLLKF